MGSTNKQLPGRGALDIIEEVFHLLRNAPVGALAAYYLGSLPFVLSLLYFWADMSKSAFAHSQLSRGALLMALLFIWMKTWHCVYARLLWCEVCGEPPPRLTPRRFLRTAVRQTIVQPSGLFILPAALLAALPFGWTYAFYQNVTVLDDGEKEDLRSLVRKAADLSKPWQRQNLLLIWALSPYLLVLAAILYLVVVPVVRALTLEWTGIFLAFYTAVFLLALMPLSPFGVIIAANIASAIIYLPGLLKTLLGVQTVFVMAPGAMFNTTLFAVVCGLTYLCMDPLLKAAYVLRCFYGESVRTGQDLRVELKRFARKTISGAKAAAVCILLAALMFCKEAVADETRRPEVQLTTGISSQELDRALDEELRDRRYAWRMPRMPRSELEQREGHIAAFFRKMADKLADWGEPIAELWDRIAQWFKDTQPDRAKPEPRKLSEISDTLRLTLYLLSGLLLCIAAVMFWRIWRRRGPSTEVIAEAVAAAPDLADEDIAADELPEDEWLSLARELTDRGEYRAAVRAVFLASLAHLAERDLIHIARFKSNFEYTQELARRAHTQPEILDSFSRSVAIYESVWYGVRQATRELVHRVIKNQEQLRVCGQTE